MEEHLTTISSLTGGEYVRCQACGQEATSCDELAHHRQCPVVE